MSKGEGRSKKKCLAGIVIFIVIQTLVIVALALTVGKIKNPKMRFNAIAIESLVSSNNNSSSISMILQTQVTIRNTNFGHFRYDNGTLTILYNGISIGEAIIPSGRVGARKTRRFNVPVNVSANNLGNDINSGVLRLTSRATLRGKVHLIKVVKKNKSAEMNCDWNVNLANRQVQNLRCN